MGSHARRYNERSVEPRRGGVGRGGYPCGGPSPSTKYKKEKFFFRVVWTVVSNLLLLRAAFGALRRADAVLFTGSPPLMLHFIAPLNIILKKHLIYRITDFYPECLIAERGRRGLVLDLLFRLTQFWRRRIDVFEVLGVDQARRLQIWVLPKNGFA